jgi:uncharacterized protein with GYD domain
LKLFRAPIEKLGGITPFFALGPFDVLAITEFPDNISAAAISLASAAGGAVSDIQTIPMLTAAQSVEAMRKAGTCGYESITLRKWGTPESCAPLFLQLKHFSP